jgi:maleamate amidohydrolase
VPVLALARERGWPVAHSRIVYADDDSDATCSRQGARHADAEGSTTPHQRHRAELAPRAGELVVRKNVPSAFFGTSLAPWLTGQGVRTLLVAGCVTSGCVRASVVDAMCWGFRPWCWPTAWATARWPRTEASLFDMEQKYADVMSLQSLEDRLPSAR